jgi:hypothetical protein
MHPGAELNFRIEKQNLTDNYWNSIGGSIMGSEKKNLFFLV